MSKYGLSREMLSAMLDAQWNTIKALKKEVKE